AAAVERRLVSILQVLDTPNIGDLNRRRFTSVLKELRGAELPLWTSYADQLIKDQEKLAGLEAKTQAKTFGEITDAKLETLSAAAAYEAARLRPLTATGELLEPFIKAIPERAWGNTNKVMQRAWNEGWTIQQAVQGIRG